MPVISTFIGIAVHNATASGATSESTNLADGVRQGGAGLLGTTAQWSDLVNHLVGEFFKNNLAFGRSFPSWPVDFSISVLWPFYRRT